MPKIYAESRYLASIYFGPMPEVPMGHGLHQDPSTSRCTIYRLKPVKRGEKPYVIEVTDAYENVPDRDRSEAMQKRVSMPRLVPCDEIIQGLLTHWTGNMVDIPTGAAPGIMQVVNETPTQEEIRQMLAVQIPFAEHLFTCGEKKHRDHDPRITIQEIAAAKWLGRERIWSQPELSSNTVDCPACKQTIPHDAIVCYHCGTKIKQFSGDLAILNPTPGVVSGKPIRPDQVTA